MLVSEDASGWSKPSESPSSETPTIVEGSRTRHKSDPFILHKPLALATWWYC